MDEILALLRENTELLKEIRALLLMQTCDSDYINQQDMKAFCINVLADIFVEMMENDKEFKNKIRNNFMNNGPVHSKNG